MNNDRVVNRTLLCKRHLFKLGLVDHPECDRCKQASETISYTFCDCKTLSIYRIRQAPGPTFYPTADFEDISFSRILHFVAGVGLLNA